jgi:pyridoxine 5-phosphate synthase
VEADEATLLQAIKLKAHAVEIHTGDYAKAVLTQKPFIQFLSLYEKAFTLIKSNQMGFHAGHGLTPESLRPLLACGQFEEYNIGHWIIGQAVFDGLENVIKSLLVQMKGSL